ncbi:MAG: hypothetical protein ABW166_00085, partial [Sedimenticola sp.]
VIATASDVTLAQEATDRLVEQIESLSKGPRVPRADELIAQLEQQHKSRCSTSPEELNSYAEVE